MRSLLALIGLCAFAISSSAGDDVRPFTANHPPGLPEANGVDDETAGDESRPVGADRADDSQSGLSPNIQMRGSLTNSLLRFRSDEPSRIAFIGGSITEMNGYRPMVAESLTQRFPGHEFEVIDAGIASTCSTTGAFRLQRDVLSKGRIDLLFVEFAVNDDQDARHTRRQCIRGMEGIVRQLRRHNPCADLVIAYFVNPNMRDQLQNGEEPLPIAAHRAVAEHYDIPTIHLAREVVQRIGRGELTWDEFGGTHPAPRGNRICAEMIGRLFDRAWSGAADDLELAPHPSPEKPLDPGHFGSARFIDFDSVAIESGWTVGLPDWESLPGSKRQRFLSREMLHAAAPGAEFTFSFSGQTAIAYVSAGPDAGRLEVSVDGNEFPSVELYHHFSKGLHYPRSVVLATDLEPGDHTVTVRLSAERNPASLGTAARIIELGVN